MKIQIKSLRAVNIGPLKDVTLDFTDPSGQPRQNTLIGGANGNGKTTVLELIFGLLETLDPNLLFSNASILSLIQNPSEQYAHLDLVIDETPITVLYGDRPDAFEATGEFLGVYREEGLILARKPYNNIQRQGTLQESMKFFESIQNRIAAQGNMKLAFGSTSNVQDNFLAAPSILFFPHIRDIAPTRGESIVREETAYLWAYQYHVVRTFSGSLNSYLIWLEYAEPHEFLRVTEFLSEHFDGKKFDILRKELKSIVSTHDGQIHDVDKLSSGEQNLLVLLLELRRRLLPNSIVLIDEIENSLHPAFQHRIGQALKKMQREIPFQMIVTSHAPAFLKIIGSENTLLLPDPKYYDTDNQAAAA